MRPTIIAILQSIAQKSAWRQPKTGHSTCQIFANARRLGQYLWSTRADLISARSAAASVVPSAPAAAAIAAVAVIALITLSLGVALAAGPRIAGGLGGLPAAAAGVTIVPTGSVGAIHVPAPIGINVGVVPGPRAGGPRIGG